MKCTLITLLLCIVLYTQAFAQTDVVNFPSSSWSSLIKLDNFDPNDDQQSNADTDFVGNATHSLMETQNETVTFTDGIVDDVFYFRARMGSSIPNTSFYFGLDVTGDFIADIFIEANVKSQLSYVAYHLRDYSKTGISPSQTSWLNGSQNNEVVLTSRNATISDYSAGTDIDGGNSGIDYWIEFGFTEESLKLYIQNNFGITINGDTIIALYGFTSTSQTSNGDIMGVDDTIPGELDKTWVELGVIINGTLSNLSSGVIVTPAVDNLTTEDTTPIITGTWGSNMLGDDSLTVTVDNIDYTESNGLDIDNLNWSLPITTSLNYGTYDVIASTYRTSSNQTANDLTTDELYIVPTGSDDSGDSSSSGNDGGLESNGNLANLIARRNFKKAKTSVSLDQKKSQRNFNKGNATVNTNRTNELIENYLPVTGYYGTESSSVSSPEDLLNITNADKIVSVDYYEGENRVAAAFLTETSSDVYSHSKTICDRLNGSSIEDAWLVSINGYQIIGSKIERTTGNIEYALNFSIKLEDQSNELFSFWNVSQYPSGNFYNFQIWGSSFLQVYSIANYAIDTISGEKPLDNIQIDDVIPQVFVKSGHYSNGIIYLNILNKGGALSATLEGSSIETEISFERKDLIYTLDLTGHLNESIEITTLRLFDVGLELKTEMFNQSDVLYLADGPWGIDYLNDLVTIDLYDVENNAISNRIESFEIERQPTVIGQLKGVMNLFRHVLPGDQTLDIINYNSIEFSILNTQEVEIILVNENIENWDNRWRYTIPTNTNKTDYSVLFTEFKDDLGNRFNSNDIKTVVFSIIGDYTMFIPFEIKINSLAFTNLVTLNGNEIKSGNLTLSNYPNPFISTTTIELIRPSKHVDLIVYDLLGRVIDKKQILVKSKTIIYKTPPLVARGIYKYILVDDIGVSHYGTFLISSF